MTITERHCRMCGCTEDRACLTIGGEGCRWSISDLSICSVCAGEEEAQPFDFPPCEELEAAPHRPLGWLALGLVIGGWGGYAWGWNARMDVVLETARMACEAAAALAGAR